MPSPGHGSGTGPSPASQTVVQSAIQPFSQPSKSGEQTTKGQQHINNDIKFPEFHSCWLCSLTATLINRARRETKRERKRERERGRGREKSAELVVETAPTLMAYSYIV